MFYHHSFLSVSTRVMHTLFFDGSSNKASQSQCTLFARNCTLEAGVRMSKISLNINIAQ